MFTSSISGCGTRAPERIGMSHSASVVTLPGRFSYLVSFHFSPQESPATGPPLSLPHGPPRNPSLSPNSAPNLFVFRLFPFSDSPRAYPTPSPRPPPRSIVFPPQSSKSTRNPSNSPSHSRKTASINQWPPSVISHFQSRITAHENPPFKRISLNLWGHT